MNLLRSELIDNVSQSQHIKDLEYSKLLKEVSHPTQLKDVYIGQSIFQKISRLKLFILDLKKSYLHSQN